MQHCKYAQRTIIKNDNKIELVKTKVDKPIVQIYISEKTVIIFRIKRFAKV